MIELRPLRWVLTFLIGLLLATMGGAASPAGRSEIEHSLIAAKTTVPVVEAIPESLTTIYHGGVLRGCIDRKTGQIK